MNLHITEPLPKDKKARLVFGLEWRAYPVKGVRAERRRYADDLGATHFTELKVAGEMVGGFGAPEAAEYRGAKLYSGAARIALHDRIKGRPAALVLLQDAQRVNLVFVVRGAVRNDEVLSPESAKARQLEIEQECLRLNLALTTFGSGPAITDVNEAFRSVDLLAQKKVGAVRKLPLALPALIPLTVIVAALFFAGSRIIDLVSPPPAPPHQPDWQERYADAIRSRFAAQPPRAAVLAPQLLESIGAIDSNLGGWQFDHEDCGTRGNCAVTYRRAGGTYDGFTRQASPSMVPVSFQRDGLHLTVRGQAIPKALAVSLKDEKSWPREQAFIAQVQTPAQRLSDKQFDIDSYGYRAVLDPAGPLIPATDPAARASAHGLLQEGKWEIDGYRWQASLLERLPSNMTLESLTVTLQTEGTVGIKFVAKGKYYVLP